jgi:hypothetical protein
MLSYSTKQPTTLSEIPQATTNCACANVFLLYPFLTSKGEMITNDGITKTTKKMPQEILLDLSNSSMHHNILNVLISLQKSKNLCE